MLHRVHRAVAVSEPRPRPPSLAPVRTAVIGLGGYAGAHHHALVKLEASGDSRLVAACDPHPARFVDAIGRWRFAERGVPVFADYRDMLARHASALDLLVVPTPIGLHAEMHRAGVEAGVPVYLEKPPTLDPAELEAMIALDCAASRSTLVGFNFAIEPARLELKTRLLAGDFGVLREVRLHAAWPRTPRYFTRNNWAGRLLDPHGRLLLDSCFANAMAHFVHNALQWAGTRAPLDWDRPAEVRAELYRAHAIEGADTFFVAARTASGIPLRLALTHACHGAHHHCETLVCEHATLDYSTGGELAIRWRDGRAERHPLPPFDTLLDNHRAYHRYLRGEAPRPGTRLADSRAFVELNALAYLSSREITPFPAASLTWHAQGDGTSFVEVDGLGAAQTAFLEQGVWPAACSALRDSPPVSAGPSDLPALNETVRRIVAPPLARSAAMPV
jgi:predicted dehydrogenase